MPIESPGRKDKEQSIDHEDRIFQDIWLTVSDNYILEKHTAAFYYFFVIQALEIGPQVSCDTVY